VVDDLNNQNVSSFLWALVAWALVRASRGQSGTAAAALAAGATLKVMPGFAFISLLAPGAPGRARAVLGFLAGLLGVALTTVLTLGGDLFAEAVRFWSTRIVPHAGVRFGAGNRGWSGLAARWWEGSDEAQRRWVHLLGNGTGLAVLAGLVAVVYLRPARTFRGVALDALLVTAAGVLTLPIVWSHYLVLCIPLALAVLASLHELEPAERRLACGLLAAGALLSCFFNVDLVGPRVWGFVDHHGSTLWGTLLLLAAGLVLRGAWRRGDDAAAARCEPPAAGPARRAGGCALDASAR
jgi:hypothetical protein